MRAHSTFRLSLGGLLLLTAPSAHAQVWGRPSYPSTGVCFFEDINYGGDYFCTRLGTSTPQVPYRTNNQISSMRVFGGAEITVFSESSYRGSSRRFSSDVRDLRRSGFNDRISSFRLDSRGNWGGAYGGGSWGEHSDDWNMNWGRPSVPSSGACFYQNPHYGGEYFCARVGVNSSNVPRGTNDKVSAIRLFGNAEVTVFQDSRFEGRSQHFSSDMGDLRRAGWNDLISSFRVGVGGGNHGRWGGAYGGGSSGSGHGHDKGSSLSYSQAQSMVNRAYRSVLGRAPDPGAASWVTETMKNNWSQVQLEATLRRSPEYRAKHGR